MVGNFYFIKGELAQPVSGLTIGQGLLIIWDDLNESKLRLTLISHLLGRNSRVLVHQKYRLYRDIGVTCNSKIEIFQFKFSIFLIKLGDVSQMLVFITMIKNRSYPFMISILYSIRTNIKHLRCSNLLYDVPRSFISCLSASICAWYSTSRSWNSFLVFNLFSHSRLLKVRVFFFSSCCSY